MKSELISGGGGGGGGRLWKNSSSDHETKAWRQAQEQRHLEAYKGMQRFRDAVCHRYTALLRDKTARAKSHSQPEQKQKKPAFSKLQHNDSYLKALPKTSYYLICDLQKQLAGHLKCHRDLEDFHSCIKYHSHPSELQRSLQDVRRIMLERRYGAFLTQHKKTAVSCTTDDRGHKEHPLQYRSLKPECGPGKTAKEPIFDGSQEEDESGQMFLKMKAPTFATLQPKFMRNFQSKLPAVIIPEIPEKSRKAEIYLKRLKQMYDLSLANMAFTQRLLDRETDLLYWQRERGVQDLVLPAKKTKQVKERCISQLPVCSLKQPGTLQSHLPLCTRSLIRKTSTSLHCSEASDTKVGCCKIPLTIEDVYQQKHVKIIDCGTKLWTNSAEKTNG